MTKKRSKRLSTPRTTLALTGTAARVPALLDAASVLAVDYTQQWHRRHGSPKVPASGVIRRALEVYVRSLDSADPRSEVRATASACKALATEREAQTDALLRLHATDPDAPLPSFDEVLHGRAALAERKARHARLDALLAVVAP